MAGLWTDHLHPQRVEVTIPGVNKLGIAYDAEITRTDEGPRPNLRLPASFLLLCNRVIILYNCLGAYLVWRRILEPSTNSHYFGLLYRRLFQYKGHRRSCAKD